MSQTEARDTAARVAEHDLTRRNAEWERDVAMWILADFISDVDEFLADDYPEELRDPKVRLAWALKFMESCAGTSEGEEKVVQMTWDKIREDADQLAWEEMGL